MRRKKNPISAVKTFFVFAIGSFSFLWAWAFHNWIKELLEEIKPASWPISSSLFTLLVISIIVIVLLFLGFKIIKK